MTIPHERRKVDHVCFPDESVYFSLNETHFFEITAKSLLQQRHKEVFVGNDNLFVENSTYRDVIFTMYS